MTTQQPVTNMAQRDKLQERILRAKIIDLTRKYKLPPSIIAERLGVNRKYVSKVLSEIKKAPT